MLVEAINRVIEFLFLQNGIITIPIFSTMLVFLFKAMSHNGDFDSDAVKSALNMGLDLATAGIFVLLTSISFSVASIINNSPDEISDVVYQNLFLHGAKIVLYIFIVLAFSFGIRIFAWDKTLKSPKNTWRVIISIDIIGILLLALSILFAGGSVYG